MAESLQEGLERVLRDYPAARAEPLKDHPLARFIRAELPVILQQKLRDQIGQNSYVVSGTKFMGSWAYVPWISILDPEITDSNQRGIYGVCLFAEDGSSFILAVGEGVTEASPKTIAEDRRLILSANDLPIGFQVGPAAEGTLGQSASAKSYEQGTICYKRYPRGSVPSDSDLLTDMRSVIEFVSKAASSSIFSSLSFVKSSADSGDNAISFRGVMLTQADLLQAFNNAEPDDWEGQHGQDPYWMIEVSGKRKPLKAVFRKASGALANIDFTSHEAARIVRQLGLMAVNEREEQSLSGKRSTRQWSFAPGRDADRWQEVQELGEITIGWDELGDLSRYGSMDEILEALKQAYGEAGGAEPTNNARCNWEYSHVIKPGDLIYARRGRRHLLGIGEVTGPYRWVESRSEHKHVIPVKWLKTGDWQLPEGSSFGIKTLTNITPYPDFVEILNLLAGRIEDAPVGKDAVLLADVPKPAYPIEAFATETGLDGAWLQSLANRMHRKKHLVLQGPPGTGKTFIAKGIARHLIGGTIGISEIVQFHPSYSYEDFVQGLKPHSIGGSVDFVLEPGRFLQFCASANIISPAPAIMIIDELNRANLSRVFGELMYLLEYRGESVPLASGGARFSIPGNVRIIATMNTADRSIALVDHALRRRFSFAYVAPDYTVLTHHLAKHALPVESLIAALKQVNLAIGDRHYEVGISFFLGDGSSLRESLPEIWTGEIEPYLDDYFYDEPQKADALRWANLRKTVLAEWQ